MTLKQAQKLKKGSEVKWYDADDELCHYLTIETVEIDGKEIDIVCDTGQRVNCLIDELFF